MARVLLLEDDTELRHGLAEVLGDAGHTVVEAGDGRAALNIVREARPDILVTDLVMDGMEGIQTILEIKRLSDAPPVVAISGNPLYLSNSRKLGADAVLLKPFTGTELVETVASLLHTDA